VSTLLEATTSVRNVWRKTRSYLILSSQFLESSCNSRNVVMLLFSLFSTWVTRSDLQLYSILGGACGRVGGRHQGDKRRDDLMNVRSASAMVTAVCGRVSVSLIIWEHMKTGRQKQPIWYQERTVSNDMHEGRRQQLINIHIITTRWSRRVNTP